MVCHLIVAINAYRGNVYNEHVLKVGLVSLCLGLFLQSFDLPGVVWVNVFVATPLLYEAPKLITL